jgi:hypothetical protein
VALKYEKDYEPPKRKLIYRDLRGVDELFTKRKKAVKSEAVNLDALALSKAARSLN